MPPLLGGGAPGYPPGSPPRYAPPPAPQGHPAVPQGTYGAQGPHGPQGSRPGKRMIDYPRSGRRGILRWIPSWKLFAGTSITMVMTLVIGLLVAYAATTVPPIQPITQAQTTTVLYSQGSVLTKFVFEQQNRTIVPVGEIPKYVLMSVVSAEDRTFYQNKGISPLGILRAAWNDIRGRPLQGGSTITQQYVKNTRITNERSISRKIKEFFIAIKIANQTDKNQLLGDYLNTIYFGRGTYGIQAAARAYFGKDATFDPKHPERTLTPQQAAYLAGIIDGPELYDVDPAAPQAEQARVLARTKARYDYVLDGMVKLGVISQADRATRYAAMPTPNPKRQLTTAAQPDDQTGYLTSMVRSELTQLSATYPELAPDRIATGGYNIWTTVSKDLTNQAVTSVEDTLGNRSTWKAHTSDGTVDLRNTQIGLVSLDPQTGAVKAIYGGDGKRSQSAATQDNIPAGSTFKLFSLLAALEGPSKNGQDGIALTSRFSGKSPYRYQAQYAAKDGKDGSKVFNDGNEQMSSMNLKEALKHSVNTIFAQLNEQVTPQRTQAAAWRAGIPKLDQYGRNVVGPEISNTLGNAAVHVIDLASAYGTVAAEGMYNKPYVIDRVVSNDGKTIVYRHPEAPVRRFASDVCDDAMAALQGPVSGGGTAQYAGSHLDRPIAGKTGTVGALGSRKTKSAWFVGFTPQLVTAVAMHRVGKNNGQDDVIGWGPFNGQNMQGGYFPVRIWTDFMQAALKGDPVEQFPSEKDVGVPNQAGQDFQTFQHNQDQNQNQNQTPSPTDGQPNDSPAPSDPNAQTTDPNNPGQQQPSSTAVNGGNGGGGGGGGGQSTAATTSPTG